MISSTIIIEGEIGNNRTEGNGAYLRHLPRFSAIHMQAGIRGWGGLKNRWILPEQAGRDADIFEQKQ